MSAREALSKATELASRADYRAALHLLQELLRRDLGQEERDLAQIQQAGLLMALGRKAEAVPILERLAMTETSREVRQDTLPRLYIAAAQTGQFAEVMGRLEVWAAESPNDLRRKQTLADLYACSHDAGKEGKLREELAHRRGDFEGWMELSQFYVQHERKLDAADMLGKAATVAGERAASCFLQKAALEYHAGDRSRAKASCAQVLQQAETDAQSVLRAGLLYAQMDSLPEALAAFEMGERLASETFRKQRCQLEACKIRCRLNAVNQTTLALLSSLQQNAHAQAVREEADRLLAQLRSTPVTP